MSADIYIDAETSPGFTGGEEDLIKRAVCAALESENFNPDCEINILIADAGRIREINREFRDTDAETDVLSFPFYTRDEITAKKFPPGKIILGDIVISPERAAAQERGRVLAALSRPKPSLFCFSRLPEEERTVYR